MSPRRPSAATVGRCERQVARKKTLRGAADNIGTSEAVRGFLPHRSARAGARGQCAARTGESRTGDRRASRNSRRRHLTGCASQTVPSVALPLNSCQYPVAGCQYASNRPRKQPATGDDAGPPLSDIRPRACGVREAIPLPRLRVASNGRRQESGCPRRRPKKAGDQQRGTMPGRHYLISALRCLRRPAKQSPCYEQARSGHSNGRRLKEAGNDGGVRGDDKAT